MEGPYFLLCLLYNIITKEGRGWGLEDPHLYYEIYVQPLMFDLDMLSLVKAYASSKRKKF